MQVLLCLAVFTLRAQNTSISISGTVKDKASNAPIAQADVVLTGYDLKTTTDANGRFSLTGTVGTKNGRAPSLAPSFKSYAQSRGIVLDLSLKAPVSIRFYDLAGRTSASMDYNAIDAGQYLFTPDLAPGLYFCKTVIQGKASAFKYYATANPRHSNSLSKTNGTIRIKPLAKTAQGAFLIEAWKKGYTTGRTSVSGSDANLIAYLEGYDMAASGNMFDPAIDFPDRE
jgi:hypothetical protein